MMSLEKAVAYVKKHKNFLITIHANPEGDALGSALAFSNLVRKLGKGAIIMNEEGVPGEYGFLPVKNNNIIKYRDNLKNIRFDCMVFLDCSDPKRTGEVYRINSGRNRPILNIDHHISNQYFGQVNWVEPSASSCSEMIYKLYQRFGIPLDKDSALLLYAGIVADTGSFRYSNTTGLTHKIVSELLRYNLNVPQVYRDIYENLPFSDVRLLMKILPKIRRQEKGRIAWFQIKAAMLRNKKISLDLTEYLLSFARAIEGVEVAVLFKENLGVKDEIRINFRSQGDIDVNKIASSFGGGGHKAASGATVHGKIDRVRLKVLLKIRESLK